ncbi:hypothetical protein IE81DRAFT_347529 [Ceraceosorus guamensis]|uniref:Uncharacterized protein n=1 Tax=Ceraceosorus guamensis TaxID=1522189 RepID=A0A316W138_9BASI|nr:hypothetical protein IE81DRAFT_347529 [Ceraceosorus guamensis]PWN42271.1 hypothetical protein IE81DRAFT_347529 [Ceraceosorus guamensis]
MSWAPSHEVISLMAIEPQVQPPPLNTASTPSPFNPTASVSVDTTNTGSRLHFCLASPSEATLRNLSEQGAPGGGSLMGTSVENALVLSDDDEEDNVPAARAAPSLPSTPSHNPFAVARAQAAAAIAAAQASPSRTCTNATASAILDSATSDHRTLTPPTTDACNSVRASGTPSDARAWRQSPQSRHQGSFDDVHARPPAIAEERNETLQQRIQAMEDELKALRGQLEERSSQQNTQVRNLHHTINDLGSSYRKSAAAEEETSQKVERAFKKLASLQGQLTRLDKAVTKSHNELMSQINSTQGKLQEWQASIQAKAASRLSEMARRQSNFERKFSELAEQDAELAAQIAEAAPRSLQSEGAAAIASRSVGGRPSNLCCPRWVSPGALTAQSRRWRARQWGSLVDHLLEKHNSPNDGRAVDFCLQTIERLNFHASSGDTFRIWLDKGCHYVGCELWCDRDGVISIKLRNPDLPWLEERLPRGREVMSWLDTCGWKASDDGLQWNQNDALTDRGREGGDGSSTSVSLLSATSSHQSEAEGRQLTSSSTGLPRRKRRRTHPKLLGSEVVSGDAEAGSAAMRMLDNRSASALEASSNMEISSGNRAQDSNESSGLSDVPTPRSSPVPTRNSDLSNPSHLPPQTDPASYRALYPLVDILREVQRPGGVFERGYGSGTLAKELRARMGLVYGQVMKASTTHYSRLKDWIKTINSRVKVEWVKETSQVRLEDLNSPFFSEKENDAYFDYVESLPLWARQTRPLSRRQERRIAAAAQLSGRTEGS